MNHKLILSLACILLLFSCKKTHNDAPQADVVRYPVKFDVNGFTQTQVPLGGTTVKTNTVKTNTATDTIPVNQLWYFVYSSTGIVSMKTVEKTAGGFGVFTDNLAAGNYSVYFWGSSIDVDYTMFGLTPKTNAPNWGDTFVGSTSITITNTGINQSITLHRLSAQIELNIEDAVPANVSKIVLGYQDINAADPRRDSGIPAGSLLPYFVSRTISAADIGSVNLKIYANVLASQQSNMPVTIAYYTTGASPDNTKTVNVAIQTNKRTIITGKLFTSNSSFSVSYADWNPSVTIGF